MSSVKNRPAYYLTRVNGYSFYDKTVDFVETYARVDHLLCEDEEKKKTGRDSVSGKTAQLLEAVAAL